MGEDPKFALQCLLDSIDRLRARNSLDELFTELANYLDSVGEHQRALVIRGGYVVVDADLDKVLNHIGADFESVFDEEWVQVPRELTIEQAELALDAALATLGEDLR